MEKAVTLFFLGINAWHDWKKREILLGSVCIYAIWGIVWAILQKRIWQEYILLFVMGMFLILVSVCTRGALGLGDVWILLALGFVMKPEKYLWTVLTAWVGAAAFSGVLVILKKAGKKTEIPFIPFLLAGYTGGLFLW